MPALQMPSNVDALVGDLAVHHAGDPLFLYLSDLLAGRADGPRLLTLMAVLVITSRALFLACSFYSSDGVIDVIYC